MGSPDPPAEPARDAADPPDWELLSSLFGRGGPYRHRMGLRRGEAAAFYAATAAGPAIRREKEGILDCDGGLRSVVTPEGGRGAVEFARLLGLAIADPRPDDRDGCLLLNHALALALEPDLLIVEPPDWSLVWANVCFPSRWSLEGKSRRPIWEIHDAVPGLNADLGRNIGAFFARLAPGEGWRRANWGLTASATRDQHPARPLPKLTAATRPDDIFVRVEDQHLLRLATGMIAFGIRIAHFRWADIRQHGEIGISLMESLRSMSEEVTRYKGLAEVIPSITE